VNIIKLIINIRNYPFAHGFQWQANSHFYNSSSTSPWVYHRKTKQSKNCPCEQTTPNTAFKSAPTLIQRSISHIVIHTGTWKKWLCARDKTKALSQKRRFFCANNTQAYPQACAPLTYQETKGAHLLASESSPVQSSLKNNTALFMLQRQHRKKAAVVTGSRRMHSSLAFRRQVAACCTAHRRII